MIDTILPLMSKRRASSVVTKYSKSFVEQCNGRIQSLIDSNRSSTSSISGSGIEFLASYLRMADIDYYRKFTDDIDRYIKIEKDLHMFYNREPWLTDGLSSSQFSEITDIVLPTQGALDASRIPLGSSDWNTWKKVKPLRVVNVNSTELSMWNHTGKLTYRKTPPTVVTHLLDVPLLILMYCKYIDVHENQHIDEYKFIFDICVAPMLQDVFRCWNLDVIGLYSMFIALDPHTEVDLDLVTIDTVGKDVVRKKDCLKYHGEIVDVLSKIANASISVVQGMNSIYIQKDETLYDYIQEFADLNRPIGKGSQFAWQQLCSELWIRKALLNIYNLQMGKPATNEVRKVLLRQCRRYKRMKFEQHIKFLPGKDFIKEGFDEIHLMVK